MLHGGRGGQSRWGPAPAGIVLERLPGARLRSLLQHEARRWERLSLPVLLTLRGGPDEIAAMTEMLDELDSIAGLLIDAGDAIDAAVKAARSRSALPLLALLPTGDATLAQACVAAGADALVVAAYPHAASEYEHQAFEGSLIGPVLASRTLLALRQVVAAVEVSLIALGGVADVGIARQCLTAGALAVMIDGALYGDPHAPQRIGAALQGRAATDAASA